MGVEFPLPSSQDDACPSLVGRSVKLLAEYRARTRPFLSDHAPGCVRVLDRDADRLSRLLDHPDTTTVCFLGDSGVGKSTLINAIAAGAETVLPAGGTGPMTAMSAEIRYADVASLEAVYHSRALVQKIIAGLEGTEGNEDFEADDRLQRAKMLIAGKPSARRGVDYLVSALCIACGRRPDPEFAFEAGDETRVRRLAEALTLADTNSAYRRGRGRDVRGFSQDLAHHIAGFLAPITGSLVIHWPSDLARKGVRLVDLPGLGIAHDGGGEITEDFIGETARAVVLVVSRGVTNDVVRLLRDSGYWNRLLACSHEAESDPCTLIVAVTKVDQAAEQAWRDQSDLDPSALRDKRELYNDFASRVRHEMPDQIAEQLPWPTPTGNDAIDEARAAARKRLLNSLEIYPVAATEYRKIIAAKAGDPPFLSEIGETGVPDFAGRLAGLAAQERELRTREIQKVFERLSSGILGELEALKAVEGLIHA